MRRNSGYLYDPHTHTAETSACGRMPARELVGRYHQAGFSGIVVTDHLYHGFLAAQPNPEDWQACVSAYLAGYRAAKAEGDRIGLDVLLGAELRFPESQRDFLLYGIDEAFLRANPFLCELSYESFARRVQDGILTIHAHPFRAAYACEMDWNLPDGAEIYNANVRHENNNNRAESLCKAYPRLIRTAGSDAHRTEDVGRAGVSLPHRVQESAEFAESLRRGDYILYCGE